MKTITGRLFTSLCVLALFATTGSLSAANKEQLLLLETAGNIKFVSQEITKAYFYKGKGIRTSAANRSLKKGLSTLESGIKTLSSLPLGEEEKNVLQYFSFTKDELVATLAEPYSLENGALIMDYSEALLEGADLITNNNRRLDDSNETMFVDVERMRFLLVRINKYYIAHYSGLKDYVNVTQLQNSVAEFETILKEVSSYKGFHASQQTSIQKIQKFWPVAKGFFLGVEAGSLPVIVLASSRSLEKELEKLRAYFHKETLK